MSSICGGCNEVIEGRVIRALDKVWHPEHFVCSNCNKQIQSSFKSDNGKLYCGTCNDELFGKKCFACDQIIRDNVINALGRQWHQEHFTCLDCKKPVTSTKFHQVDGSPCCEKCFEKKHCEKCKKCDKPVVERKIMALDSTWHPECFKCGKCKKVIESESFGVQDGKPVCQDC